MGLILSCCTSALCCAGRGLCSGMASCCSGCGVKAKSVPRVTYVFV